MPDVNDFFSLINRVDAISKEDEKQAVNFLESIDAFARTTYKSLYVINYNEKGFDYVSDNPLFLCGNTAEEVKKMGYEFYMKHVPEDDLKLLLKINTLGFEFYESLAIEERKNYTLSYDFHLINNNGEKTLINQKITPLFLTEKGELWKAICLVSLSSEDTSGHIRVYKKRDNKVYNYDLDGDFWKETTNIELTSREKEMIQLSTRGYTINEIADALFISPDTIKFHRKKLFEKLSVANISEAIAYAKNNKLV